MEEASRLVLSRISLPLNLGAHLRYTYHLLRMVSGLQSNIFTTPPQARPTKSQLHHETKAIFGIKNLYLELKAQNLFLLCSVRNKERPLHKARFSSGFN
jgi:hypothetical protein